MKYMKTLMPALLAGSVAACGGGSGSSTTTPPPAAPVTVNVSGSVTAVNGQVAFYSPDVIDSLIAVVIGKPVFAAITGETSVGAGVTINLIEVDVNGVQVGDVIASAITDASGNY